MLVIIVRLLFLLGLKNNNVQANNGTYIKSQDAVIIDAGRRIHTNYLSAEGYVDKDYKTITLTSGNTGLECISDFIGVSAPWLYSPYELARYDAYIWTTAIAHMPSGGTESILCIDTDVCGNILVQKIIVSSACSDGSVHKIIVFMQGGSSTAS